MQKKEKDLENTKKVVVEFKKMSVKIRQQKKVEKNESLEKVQKIKLNLNTKEVRRSKLLEKYMTKILFR